jgi:hypothetical protein
MPCRAERTGVPGAPRLESRPAAPPEELPTGVRERLRDFGYEVFQGSRSLAAFWIRRSLSRRLSEPVEAGAKGRAGGFAGLESGSLVGAALLRQDWGDYKGQSVPAGLYTLRYAIQPAFKDHRDVSPYRDFLLLCPASSDLGGDRVWTSDELLEASRAVTGGGHPAVLALVPVEPQPSTARLSQDEAGHWILAVPGDGGSPLGLVILGQGSIPGH